jgi:hypothetical protein
VVAQYRDSIAGLGAGSTITVNPAGLTIVAGDLLYLAVFGYTSLGAPSGSDATWTERTSRTHAGPFGNTDIHKTWTAPAPGTSPSSFTVANGAADNYMWFLASISGADTSNPIDVSATTSVSFVSDAIPYNSNISPTTTDALYVGAVGAYLATDVTMSWVTTGSNQLTEREDIEDWDSAALGTRELVASGATGAKQWTETPAQTGGGTCWLSSALAIRSGSGAAATSAPPPQPIYRLRPLLVR